MRADLNKSTYETIEDYNEYIYGSADVVGLMCLKIFVNGDQEQYDKLKYSAMNCIAAAPPPGQPTSFHNKSGLYR